MIRLELIYGVDWGSMGGTMYAQPGRRVQVYLSPSSEVGCLLFVFQTARRPMSTLKHMLAGVYICPWRAGSMHMRTYVRLLHRSSSYMDRINMQVTRH